MKGLTLLLGLAAAAVAAPFATSADTPVMLGHSCPIARNDDVWIPGGETVIGDDQGYAEERPAYRATIKGFWIDRHEVTNIQFAAFVAATDYRTLAERRGDSIVFHPPGHGERPVEPRQWWRIVKGANWRHPEGPASNLSGRDDWPVVQIAFPDAQAYARWAGRDLPDEEQFERAAQGNHGPMRDQPPPEDANSWQGAFPTRNSALDGREGLAPVGCYRPNGYGLNDMIGNAWEWTTSGYLPNHAPMLMGEGAPGNPAFDPDQADAHVRVIKGGSFLCAANYCARYRPAARNAQEEQSGASHLGFRTIRKD